MPRVIISSRNNASQSNRQVADVHNDPDKLFSQFAKVADTV